VTGVDQEKRAADLADLEDKVRGESEQIYVDRDEQLSALDDRLKRRRDYLSAGKDKGFDEDDEFWARGLSNWAEDQMMPSLDEARSLAGAIFPDLAKNVAGEDPKRLRELVRQTATRDDRRLAPREIESVGTAAQEIRTALDPLRAELEKASGAKKGAITKHLHKLLDQLLAGEELSGDDAELASSIDAKNLERARQIGNGLLRDVLERADADADPDQVRELAYDLCLVEGARKEDLEAVQQWATKVKEMVADMESRREDTREAAVEGVRRLEDTWKLFRELDVKPLRIAVRVRRLLPRRDGRRGDPRAAPRPRPRAGVAHAARHHQDVEGPEAAARDQAPQGRPGVHHLGEQARVDGPRGRAGDPAGASPDGAARRRPLRDERPQRSLPARDQPEQPPEAAARPRSARDHRQQREADAPGGG
jgi:hypothetical protein